MATRARRDRKHYRTATTLTVRGAATQELPAGVCGQVEGIALVYDIVDDRGTTFAKGCLDRTIRERVAAGKVKLYVDHGDVLLTGMYDTHLHIGTVRRVWDGETDDGKPCARFSADIFDTEAGRSEHEYLNAVAATQSETGVSIGMLDGWKYRTATVNNVRCEQITEVPLREISITGEPAVPGTKVTAVRQDAGDAEGSEEPNDTPDLDAIATSAVCRQSADAFDTCAAVCEYCRAVARTAAATSRAAANAADAYAGGSGSITEYVGALASCAAACVAARSAMWYCPNGKSECRAAGALADTCVSCFRGLAFEEGAEAASYAVRALLSTTSDRPGTPHAADASTAVRAAASASPAPESATTEAPAGTTTEARADTAPPDYLRLLDGIVAHLGAPAVRAHLGPILSDATTTASDAGRSAPPRPDSNAAAGDSQDASRGATEAPTPNAAPMTDRLAFARSQLPRLYPQ